MSTQQPRPDAPVIRQLRFLIRVASLTPRLLESLASGNVESSMKLGKRRLAEGREVELLLVARAPERDRTPLVGGRE